MSHVEYLIKVENEQDENQIFYLRIVVYDQTEHKDDRKGIESWHPEQKHLSNHHFFTCQRVGKRFLCDRVKFFLDSVEEKFDLSGSVNGVDNLKKAIKKVLEVDSTGSIPEVKQTDIDITYAISLSKNQFLQLKHSTYPPPKFEFCSGLIILSIGVLFYSSITVLPYLWLAIAAIGALVTAATLVKNHEYFGYQLFSCGQGLKQSLAGMTACPGPKRD